MDKITMGNVCYNNHSEGLDPSLFNPYLQAKSLYVNAPFEERITVGSRRTKYISNRGLFFRFKPDVDCVIDSQSSQYEKYIASLPNGIIGKLEYKIVEDERMRDFLPYLDEDIILSICVTNLYIQDITNFVKSFKEKILRDHMGVLAKIEQRLLPTQGSRIFVRKDGVGFGMPITFESLGMTNLRDYKSCYSFGLALTEYLNTKSKSATFTFYNQNNFSLYVDILVDIPGNKPILNDW